jgi:hypothetical protein
VQASEMYPDYIDAHLKKDAKEAQSKVEVMRVGA